MDCHTVKYTGRFKVLRRLIEYLLHTVSGSEFVLELVTHEVSSQIYLQFYAQFI